VWVGGVADAHALEQSRDGQGVIAVTDLLSVGFGGGLGGVALAKRLSTRRAALTRVFAVVVVIVAAFILWRSAPGFFA
jgi:hypothetical protein